MLATSKKDSLVLGRIYQYRNEHQNDINGVEDNIYAKIRYNVEKRNAIIWLIPSMYTMAKDPREYIRESYNKVTFNNAYDYNIRNQLLSGTIHKNRKAMPVLIDYATPNIYDIALYEGRMLSPFNKVNRRYYHYTQRRQKDGTTRLEFRPKLYNTQLVNGFAIVDTNTGRIMRTIFNGEYDMLTFRTEIIHGEEDGQMLLPKRCSTAATFRFMGNRISAIFDADYRGKATLPDSVTITSRELMDSVRSIPLSETDKRIYREYDERNAPDTLAVDTLAQDTVPEKKNFWKDIMWHTVGDNLVTPLATETPTAEFYLTPIINPLYLRYSHSKGISYKMRLYTRYAFSPHRYLTFEPTFGYNFKMKLFYFNAPLRMTYNPKRNGYAEIVWENGNPISNSTVMDQITEELGDSIDLSDTDMDKFRDYQFRIFNNIMLFDWFDIETALVYHQRVAMDKEMMEAWDVPTEYRSFAPMIGLKFSPWLKRGPVISLDWERSIKGILKSNMEYERWEVDASWKYRIPGLRVLNLRAGYGFYSDRHERYFLDYTNFRDNNLPEGWDDDWSGEFQLLNGRVYNESSYYIRSNVSYESPMMFGTWVPYLGKYIEKERFYFSTVWVDHTRPYTEIGYGFTNRYISIGMFASFLNASFQKFGISLDFELFKRW